MNISESHDRNEPNHMNRSKFKNWKKNLKGVLTLYILVVFTLVELIIIAQQNAAVEIDSMNIGKSSQLGKHGFGSLHNLTWPCYFMRTPCIDSDFVSQIKLTKFPLINCFDRWKLLMIKYYMPCDPGNTKHMTVLIRDI